MCRLSILLFCFLFYFSGGPLPLFGSHPGDLPSALERLWPEGRQEWGGAIEAFNDGRFADALKTSQSLDLTSAPESFAEFWGSLQALFELRSLVSTRQTDLTRMDALERQIRLMAGAFLKNTPRSQSGWRGALLFEELAYAFWFPESHRSLHRASQHAQTALNTWAEGPQTEAARVAYLRLLFNLGESLWGRLEGIGGGRPHPLFNLNRFWEEATLLARTETESALSHWYLARSGEAESSHFLLWERTGRSFAKAHERLQALPDPEIFILTYGQWLEGKGRSHFDENGVFSAQPDPDRAFSIYDSFLKSAGSSLAEGTGARIKEARDALNAQELSLWISGFFRPDTRPEIQLAARNLPDEMAEIRLTPVRFSEVVSLDRLESPGTWRTILEPAPRPPQFRWLVTLPDEGLRRSREVTFQLPQPIPPGMWLVEWGPAEGPSRDILFVSDWFIQLLSDSDKTHSLVLRGKDGTPAPATELTLAQRHRIHLGTENPSWSPWTTVSHRIHTRELPLIPAEAPGVETEWLAWTSDSEFTGITWIDSSPRFSTSAPSDSWKVHFFSDRTLYVPGQTVSWRALLRRMTPDGPAIPGNHPDLRFFILPPDGSEIEIRAESPLSSLGSLTGYWKLPEESPAGLYSVEVRTTDQQVLSSETWFRVDPHTLPEWEVVLQTQTPEGRESRFFSRSEQPILLLSARYFDGRPVTEAKVQWQLHQENPHGRGWIFLASEEFETDAGGGLEFPVSLPPSPILATSYRMDVTVENEAGQSVQARHLFHVFVQPFSVELKTPARIYRPGDLIHLRILSTSPAGEPKAVAGKLRLWHIRDIEIWRHRADGRVISQSAYEALPVSARLRESREDFRLDQRIRARREVWVQELETPDEGELRFDFSTLEEGIYHLEWVTVTENDGAVRAETRFHVAALVDANLPLTESGLRILTRKTDLNVGDRVEGVVIQPAAGHPVLLTLEGGGIHHAEWMAMEGGVGHFSIPLERAHAPNIHVTARSVSDFRLYETREEIQVRHRFPELRLQLLTDQQAYLPGESPTLRIRLETPEGHPMAGEVSLRILDDALLAIQPELFPSLSDWFVPAPRGSGARTSRPMGGLLRPEPKEGTSELLARVAPGWEQIEIAPVQILSPQATPLLMRRSADHIMAEAFTSADAPQDFADTESTPPSEEDMPRLRERFESALLWEGRLVIDASGETDLPFALNDVMTRWRIHGQAVAGPDQFAEAEETVRTRLPLSLRLPIPSWFTEGDIWQAVAVVQNGTGQGLDTEVQWRIQSGGQSPELSPSVRLKVDSESLESLSFPVILGPAGVFEATVSIQSGQFSDALRLTSTLLPDEMERESFLAFSLESGENLLQIPEEHWNRQTRLQVFPESGLAQILSDHRSIWAEPSADLLTEHLARLLQFLPIQSGDSRPLPPAESMKPVKEALERFWDHDKGWSWLPHGGGASVTAAPELQAYALWVLTHATQNGFPWPESNLQRNRSLIEERLGRATASSYETAWMLYALASRFRDQDLGRPSRLEAELLNQTLRRQQELDTRTRALLALAAFHFQLTEEAQLLVTTLQNGVRILPADSASAIPTLAFWGPEGGAGQAPVESTLWALKALAHLAPDSELIAPAREWVMRQRRGSTWSDARSATLAHICLLPVAGQLEADEISSILIEVFSEDPESPLLTLRPGSEGEWEAVHLEASSLLKLRVRSYGEETAATARGMVQLSSSIPVTDARERAAGIELYRAIHWQETVPSLARGLIALPRTWESGELPRGTLKTEVVYRLKVDRPVQFLTLQDAGIPGWEWLPLSGDVLRMAESGKGSRMAMPAFERTERGIRVHLENLEAGVWELFIPIRPTHSGSYLWKPARVDLRYEQAVFAETDPVRVNVGK